jgi:hypothetical protein
MGGLPEVAAGINPENNLEEQGGFSLSSEAKTLLGRLARFPLSERLKEALVIAQRS